MPKQMWLTSNRFLHLTFEWVASNGMKDKRIKLPFIYRYCESLKRGATGQGFDWKTYGYYFVLIKQNTTETVTLHFTTTGGSLLFFATLNRLRESAANLNEWNNRETQSSRPADYWENHTPTINTQGYTKYTLPAEEVQFSYKNSLVRHSFMLFSSRLHLSIVVEQCRVVCPASPVESGSRPTWMGSVSDSLGRNGRTSGLAEFILRRSGSVALLGSLLSWRTGLPPRSSSRFLAVCWENSKHVNTHVRSCRGWTTWAPLVVKALENCKDGQDTATKNADMEIFTLLFYHWTGWYPHTCGWLGVD